MLDAPSHLLCRGLALSRGVHDMCQAGLHPMSGFLLRLDWNVESISVSPASGFRGKGKLFDDVAEEISKLVSSTPL